MTRLLLVAALAAIAACKGNPTCEKYVERSIKCDDSFKSMKGDEKDMARTMLTNFCEAAFKNETGGVEGGTKQMMLEMYAEIRTKAKCVADLEDATCPAVNKCEGDSDDDETETETETKAPPESESDAPDPQ